MSESDAREPRHSMTKVSLCEGVEMSVDLRELTDVDYDWGEGQLVPNGRFSLSIDLSKFSETALRELTIEMPGNLKTEFVCGEAGCINIDKDGRGFYFELHDPELRL